MAKFAGFLGGTYQAAVQQADAEEAWNWYCENVDSQQGQTKASYVMRSKPGFKAFCSVTGASSVRAECSLNNRGFAIFQTGASNVFYEIKADGSTVSYGTLPGDRRPQIVPGLTQLLVLVAGLGYAFDLKANTLARITDPDFPIGATKGGFLDGEFIVLEPMSQTFAISGLNDVTTWDPLDFGDVEGEPGNITTFVVDHRQIWFLGNNHGEIYVDSGVATFPFTRLDGAYMEQGAGDAVDGAFRCDNTIFWLGGNADGQGIIWRANGYTPQRISTHAIEKLIASFGSLSATTGYAYQEEGHTFARWDFPNAYGGRGASLLYDVASGFWHRRGFWNGTLGQYMADLARTHMFVFGKHLVGDWRSGTIYEQSMVYKTDAGAAIRRLRASPDLANGGKFVFYGELRLLMDVGVGLDGPPSPFPPAVGPTYLNPLAIAAGIPPGPDEATESLAGHTVPSPPDGDDVSSYVTYELSLTAFDGFSPEPIGTTGTWAGTSQAGENAVIPYSVTIDGQVSYTLCFQPPLPVSESDSVIFGLATAVTTPPLTTPKLNFSWVFAAAGIAYRMFVGSAPKDGAVIASAALTFTQAVVTLCWATDSSAAGIYTDVPAGSSLTVTVQAAGESSSSTVVLTADNTTATVIFSSTISVEAGASACLFSAGVLMAGGSGSGLLSVDLTGPGGFPFQPGFPNDGVPAGDGTDPQMIMQRSNNGGKTWSSEQSVSMGKIGDYQRLAKWSQNGRSNNRSFRVICSEPVDASLVAADLDAVPGT